MPTVEGVQDRSGDEEKMGELFDEETAEPGELIDEEKPGELISENGTLTADTVRPSEADKSTNDDSDTDHDKSLENSEEERVRGNSTIGSVVVRSSFKINEAKETDRPKQGGNRFFAYLKRFAALAWIERIILISVCVAVAAGFTTPIIIYALDTDLGDNATISIDIDNCSASKIDVQVCVSSWSGCIGSLLWCLYSYVH